MTASSEPLVSVVIPVYNGEEFIEKAIRSVQAQTYQNWDLTVGNNHSKDRTLAIAQELAAQDPRIRVVTYPKFVGVVESHNNAFTLASEQAKYCKCLDADDWLFPECIEELVKVAEAHPTVGMVTSYVLCGARVGFDGLPYPSTFMTGREVCRRRFLQNIMVFGGPSASLIRTDILRIKRPFYPLGNYHGDNEAYIDLLKDHDFGYVHQVLSYNLRGDKSRTTSYLDRVDSHLAGYILELTKYGPFFLTPEELAARLKERWREYYRFLGRAVFELRGREYWHYHAVHMRELGYPLNYPRVALWALYRFLDVLLNPFRTTQGIIRRLGELVSRLTRRPTAPPTAAGLPSTPAKPVTQ